MRVAENEKAKMVFNALHAKRLKRNRKARCFYEKKPRRRNKGDRTRTAGHNGQ